MYRQRESEREKETERVGVLCIRAELFIRLLDTIDNDTIRVNAPLKGFLCLCVCLGWCVCVWGVCVCGSNIFPLLT